MIGAAPVEPAPAIRAERASHRTDPLTIALVNNMPDGALQLTEHQFRTLLTAASGGAPPRLKLYSPPGITRGSTVRAHIARHYDSFASLQHDPPDGIIVTGTEPRCASLRDEPYFPALSWLVDWADDRAIPGIWSCLAAHAAVQHRHGIQRHAFGTKLSGLFECRIQPREHNILRGLPTSWRVPHSRLYNLHESELTSCGYQILSRSPEIGPDLFVRQRQVLQLYFQGHPEYQPATLIGEYRRDIARYLTGVQKIYPSIPRHYVESEITAQLLDFAQIAARQRNLATLPTFDAIVSNATFANGSSLEARRIYSNWLSYVDAIRAREERPGALPLDPAKDKSLEPINW